LWLPETTQKVRKLGLQQDGGTHLSD
jgi:hypothetical protein